MSEEALPNVRSLESRAKEWWDRPRFPPCGNWDALHEETRATIQLLYVDARNEAKAELRAELTAENARLREELAQLRANRNMLNELGEPCAGCGQRSRITTAGCDHCDYEDK